MEKQRFNLDEIAKSFLKMLVRSKGSSKNTVFSYASDIRKFLDYLRKLGIENPLDIKQQHIEEYFSLLRKENEESTIRRNMSSMKNFLIFLREKSGNDLLSSLKKISKFNPSKNNTRDYLTTNEIELIFSQLKNEDFLTLRDKAILMTLYFGGLRVSELCSLKIKDFDFKNRTIIIGDKRRRVYVNKLLEDSLNEYFKIRTQILRKTRKYHSSIVFLDRSGNTLTRQSIFLIVRKYSKKAGISRNISPQTLRNSIALHLYSSGASIDDLKEMLGYKVIQQNLLRPVNNNVQYKAPYLSTHPILRDK